MNWRKIWNDNKVSYDLKKSFFKDLSTARL